MFSLSTAQRVLLKKAPTKQMIERPVRRFQSYGTGGYTSGFERMVQDKLNWARLGQLSGMGFAVWGVANLGIYGLSFLMDKQNFDYHFAYTGNGKLFQPLKSMMAAESFGNVAWTAPSLILGGALLPGKVGSAAAFKLFALSVFATYAATCTLGPASGLAKLNLRGLWPEQLRFDSIDTDKGRMVGADCMAGLCLYSLCFAYGYWQLGAAFAVMDCMYYGPMGSAFSVPAAIGVATLL